MIIKVKKLQITLLFMALAPFVHGAGEDRLMDNIYKIASLLGHHIAPEDTCAKTVLDILGRRELRSSDKVNLLSKALLRKEFLGREKEQMIDRVKGNFYKVNPRKVLNITMLASQSDICPGMKIDLLDFGFDLLGEIDGEVDLKASFAKCLLMVDDFSKPSERSERKISFILSVIGNEGLKPSYKEALERLLDKKASRFVLTDPASA